MTLDGQGGSRTELLCTVRGILKKIKQSVLVGDRVRVAGIDWDDRRGARHSLPILCAFKALKSCAHFCKNAADRDRLCRASCHKGSEEA